MDNQNIVIRMSGREFEKEKNLYLMVEALSNINRVFEKSYLTISNKKRMTEKDREVFQLKAKEFKEGSLIIELGMYITALTQSSLLNVLTLSPKDIWTLIKDGYNYLKTVLKANSEGVPIRLEGDNNMILLITGNNNTVEFRPEVIPYLKMAEPNFERVSKLVNPEKGVDEFSLSNLNTDTESKLIFSTKERDLFETKTKLENEIIILKGKIFNLNANDCIGELEVLESEDISLQNMKKCKFDFVKKPQEQDFLSDIFLKEVTIYALKETYFNPVSLTKDIKKISIINIEK